MAGTFDPYHHWLGIVPSDQPPNHYRLLGIDLFEGQPEVIYNAADQRMAHVRSFHTGPHAGLSQKLLNEIAAAKLCLLNAKKKAAYDATLRSVDPRAMQFRPAGPIAPPQANAAAPALPTPLAPVAPKPVAPALPKPLNAAAPTTGETAKPIERPKRRKPRWRLVHWGARVGLLAAVILGAIGLRDLMKSVTPLSVQLPAANPASEPPPPAADSAAVTPSQPAATPQPASTAMQPPASPTIPQPPATFPSLPEIPLMDGDSSGAQAKNDRPKKQKPKRKPNRKKNTESDE